MVSSDIPNFVPQSDNDLQRFFDLSLDLLAIVVNGCFVRLNPAWERILGYAIEELLYKPAMDFIHPDDVARTQALDKQITADAGLLINFENRYRSKNGTYKWLEWTAHHYPEENIIYCIARDITDRKQTELALRKSEEQFRNMLEVATEGILVTNRLGDIVLVNQAVEKQFGYTRDELMGTPVEILLPEAHRKAHIRHRQNYAAHPRLRPMHGVQELTGKHKDGSIFPIEVSLSYIQDEDLLVIAFIIDITERKHIEQERLDHQRLQDEVKKERELIELRQRFVSMISHEFRTPLTAILSSCEILDRYYDRLTDQQRMERTQGLKAHVQLMVDLLDGILMLNKIQAGMARLNLKPLDITSMCLRLLETATLIDQGQHHLAFDTSHSSITIHADPHVLEHILTNLLSNAIKYSPAGTRIDFQLTGTEDRITFMVRDEGRGIPEEEKSHVFEPFHRAGNVGEVQGTGLGLAIVKSNVELHGGSIRFQSTEGKGTIFWVELPVALNILN
ncbi:MAG: PAS domain S-box protein [Anaerolineae bacterium]|nr:PAS domain S-box protein [Anaerolineae bacterium]